MRLSIRHTTRYLFDTPVVHALQRLRLTPKQTQGQEILEWEMEYHNAHPEFVYEDQHHNTVNLVSVETGAQEVTVTCHGRVDTHDHAGVIGRHAGHLPLWSFLAQTPQTTPGPGMRKLAGEVGKRSESRLDTLHHLSGAILDRSNTRPGRPIRAPSPKRPMRRQTACARTTRISSSVSPVRWAFRRDMSAAI